MNKQDEEKSLELYPIEKRDLLYQNQVKKSLRKAFIKGCSWKKQQMIEKAVRYLDNMLILDDGSTDKFIEDFKKYMEEN